MLGTVRYMRMLGLLGAACGALVAALVFGPPASARTVDCATWLQVPMLQKRQAVLKSFPDAPEGADHPSRALCINQAATAMTREVDAACRAGRDLPSAWSEIGLAWAVTCAAVVARSAAGDRVTLEERRAIRADWDTCMEDADEATCRLRVLQQVVDDTEPPDVSECDAFSQLPYAAKTNEVRDRIQVRFSVSMEVAQCLQRKTGRIALEVQRACAAGRDAEDAWEDALSAHTDRCLEQDAGF